VEAEYAEGGKESQAVEHLESSGGPFGRTLSDYRVTHDLPL
jgi:hypothetical protein